MLRLLLLLCIDGWSAVSQVLSSRPLISPPEAATAQSAALMQMCGCEFSVSTNFGCVDVVNLVSVILFAFTFSVPLEAAGKLSPLTFHLVNVGLTFDSSASGSYC